MFLVLLSCRTVKLKEENVQTASVGEGSSQVTKATVSDEGQDDLPIGTEGIKSTHRKYTQLTLSLLAATFVIC